jgi:hypothetical protein
MGLWSRSVLEEFSPGKCLDQVELAEATGFDMVWVNDHFYPWFDHLSDGSSAHGGNCWSWMPAALERTDDVSIGTGEALNEVVSQRAWTAPSIALRTDGSVATMTRRVRTGGVASAAGPCIPAVDKSAVLNRQTASG